MFIFPLEMNKTIIGFVFFFGLKCVINNVEVRVINLAFGLADNSYFNNDSFAYHSKQIQ